MVLSVFISSVQLDFEDERNAAKGAVESHGMRPVMAESVGASPDPSRTALLNHVEQCDVTVLILAGRYGYIGQSGQSPTEDEFDRAVACGKPVLVFVQEGVDRELRQQQFIEKVRGTWEEGLYAPGFRTPTELALAVTRSIRELQEEQQGGGASPAAQQAAAQLAAGESRHGQWTSGCLVRVAFVPVGDRTLIDAVALDDPALEESFGSVIRQHRLVPQSAGLDVQVSSLGLIGIGKDPKQFSATTVQLAADGSVMVEADVASDGMLGSMAISHERVVSLVAQGSAAAQQMWGLVDAAGRVRQVAAALGVPDASQKVYATAPVSNSVSAAFGGPQRIVAPTPALLVRRNDIGAAQTDQRLVASLKRAFVDLGAVHPR